MFLDHGDNAKDHRAYDLELNRIKVLSSVKFDEREVKVIYNTSMAGKTEIINVIKEKK